MTFLSRFRNIVQSTREHLGLSRPPGRTVQRFREDAPQEPVLEASSEETLLDLTSDAALEEMLAIENGKLVPAPVLSPRKMLAKVEAGFSTLLDLVGGVREGLAAQQKRHAADADQQSRLAQRMSMLPAAVSATARMSRQNGELLSGLSRQIERQISSQEALVHALRIVPETAREQTGVLKCIHDQLVLREETDREVVGSMLSMNETLQQMSTAGSAQIDALGRLHVAQQDQTDVVQSAMQRQNRRFGWLFGVTIGLCTFVLAGAAAIFLMLLQ